MNIAVVARFALGLSLMLAPVIWRTANGQNTPSAAAGLQPRAVEFLAADAIHARVLGACNSVVFSQVPGHLDYFLGRRGARGGSCAEVNPWSVALFKMDWRAYTLNFERTVLQGPVEVPAGNRRAPVRQVYDPSVALYNGELWVAFECATPVFIGTSACIGPFNFEQGTIDPARISLLVAAGDSNSRSPYSYTGAVPNLVVFNGRLYVYWSAIQIRKGTPIWEGIAVRGMELAQEPSGLRRMWGLGSAGWPVISHDPARTTEVLGPSPGDPYGDQTVDLKGAFAAAGNVYLILSLGGRGPDRTGDCTTALGNSAGCFRMAIFRSPQPLGIFRSRLVSPRPPANPAAYQRPLVAPDGTPMIIGEFLNPPARSSHPESTLHFGSEAGLLMYPFTPSTFKFSPE